MAELEMVEIHHPEIDAGERVIAVPKVSLPHHQMAGWQLVEPDPPQEDPPPSGDPAQESPTGTDQAPEPPGPSHVEDKPAARRRAASTKGTE